MNHLQRLGNRVSITIPPDEDVFTGRECPNPDCEGYFKIEFGTGLKGENLPCHCPYCGHTASHDTFWTKEQIEYAKSIAIRQVTNALVKDLKSLEFDHKPKGSFGIGISMKVKPGPQPPIHYYREKILETEVICSNCTLRYSVYGVFAFCPDCGQHNSLQILRKNLDIVGKMIDMAATVDLIVSERLIDNALIDCVSAFDGFGREICRVNALKSTNQKSVNKLSFQNLENAKHDMAKLFKIDVDLDLDDGEWPQAILAFQKRHLLSHKMGVVDDKYIQKSGDIQAIVGRKIRVNADEVRTLISIISKLALTIDKELRRLNNA